MGENNERLTAKELEDIGFKPLPHPTVGNNLNYDLGRYRFLSVGCLGSPNEMMCICSSDKKDPKNVTDVIILHNWDYDGYMTIDFVKGVIKALDKTKL